MLDKIKCDAFSAVVETGSFEKAGKIMCISISNFSKSSIIRGAIRECIIS